MAIIAGTATTFAGAPGLQGLREDLSNEIYMISPETTPFMSNVGRGTADAVLHEWQVDSLAPPNLANAQFQGDDISSFTPASVTTRLGNRTQISRKEVIVSGTVEAVNKAGRKSEIARQMYKRGRELKIDIEINHLEQPGCRSRCRRDRPQSRLGACLDQDQRQPCRDQPGR